MPDYSDQHDAKIAALIRSPPAGIYAEDVMLLEPVNYVGGATLGCPLISERLFEQIPGLEGRQFTAVPVRISNPESTYLLFGGGKMRVSGGKSKSAFYLGLQQMRAFLARRGYMAHLYNVSLDNIVARCNVGVPLKIEEIELAIKHNLSPLQGFSMYDPAMFSALIYRIKFYCPITGNLICITITIFESGKIMVLGITDMDGAARAVKLFQIFAQQYRNDITDTSQHKEKSKNRANQRQFAKRKKQEDDLDEELESAWNDEDASSSSDSDSESDSDSDFDPDSTGAMEITRTRKRVETYEKRKKKISKLKMKDLESIQEDINKETDTDFSPEQMVDEIKKRGKVVIEQRLMRFEAREQKVKLKLKKLQNA